MANVYAVKSGNWSDTTVWNTGALPTSADDVYSNTYTVTVDTTTSVLSIRNIATSGIVAGGTFSMTVNGITLTTVNGCGGGNSATLTVNLTTGSTVTFNGSIGANGNNLGCLVSGSGTFVVNGNITSGGTGGFYGIRVTGSANIVINGNMQPNGGSALEWISTGTAQISGNIIGFGGNGSAILTSQTGTGTITITGLITNVNAAIEIIRNGTAGTINITGSVSSTGAASGIANNSTGTINITGTATGGTSTGSAFVNNSTGTITHIGTAQASATAPAIGVGSASQVTLLTGPLLCSPDSAAGASASGVNPCIALRWFPLDTALSTIYYRMKDESVVSSARSDRDFYLTNAYETTYPSVSDVRSGVSYGPTNIYTGISSVPPRESVSFGVPVDNTTGTSAIGTFTVNDIWNYPISGITTSGSIGERLKNTATINTVSQQISDAFSSR